MADVDKKKQYSQFLDDFRDYFKDNDEVWNEKLKQCIDFIKKNDKSPSGCAKNKDEKVLGVWISV